jgi:hypothetical protein
MDAHAAAPKSFRTNAIERLTLDSNQYEIGITHHLCNYHKDVDSRK